LKAGTKSLIEIHGHLDAVSCLSCKTEVPRQAFQHRLEELNQGWLKTYLLSSVKPDDPSIIKPDGDVELRNVDYSKFVVPSCESCGTGVLKPTVVFFGDTVPRERVDHSLQVMEKVFEFSQFVLKCE
jgi:NAD-dependent SIR2 family protein deacetylase